MTNGAGKVWVGNAKDPSKGGSLTERPALPLHYNSVAKELEIYPRGVVALVIEAVIEVLRPPPK